MYESQTYERNCTTSDSNKQKLGMPLLHGQHKTITTVSQSTESVSIEVSHSLFMQSECFLARCTSYFAKMKQISTCSHAQLTHRFTISFHFLPSTTHVLSTSNPFPSHPVSQHLPLHITTTAQLNHRRNTSWVCCLVTDSCQMADKSKDKDNKANSAFTPREQEVMAMAWQCFEGEPKVCHIPSSPSCLPHH